MFIKSYTSKTQHSDAIRSTNSYNLYSVIFVATAAMTLLVGCGQKGDLYLVDSGNQAIKNSTAILDSGSNPQDAAFAKIDGSQDNNAQNNEQNTDDFQLPEPSSDPNDY